MKLVPRVKRHIDRLTWFYLDGIIDRSRLDRLEMFLQESGEARRVFIDNATLHSLLTLHFTGKLPDAGKFRYAHDRFLTALLDDPVDAPEEPDLMKPDPVKEKHRGSN